MMKVTLGWTLGEEVLFDSTLQVRKESAQCDRDSCVLKISCEKLAELQHQLLGAQGNQKCYYVLESVLKGNFLIKQNLR
jgi:hypothetical protein